MCYSVMLRGSTYIDPQFAQAEGLRGEMLCAVRREKGLDAMLADYQNGALAHRFRAHLLAARQILFTTWCCGSEPGSLPEHKSLFKMLAVRDIFCYRLAMH